MLLKILGTIIICLILTVLLPVIAFFLIILILRLYRKYQMRYRPVRPQPPSIQTRTIVLQSNDQSTTLAVLPAWYEPVKLPDADKIRLPVNYDKNSPVDVRIYQSLSAYRLMKNKDQIIDFITQPFVAAVDNTETLIVVLSELAAQLGARLSFTDKAFQYDNSDYRTACGVGNLGSIHSLIGGGECAQTARFKVHLNVNYDDVTASAQSLTNFTKAFIDDIASLIKCSKEFIRVLFISRASSLHVGCGLTTTKLEQTTQLAEQLKRELNKLSKQQSQSILQHLIRENYDYHLETVVNFLEIQELDLDPRYNRDYPDDDEEMRGGRPYFFPRGWYRHALKVDNKYPNDQAWLGMSNSPGEWSVAYHGTIAGAVKSIADGGLQHKFFTRDFCKKDAHEQRPSIPDVNGLYVATHCEGGAAEYAGAGFEIRDSLGTIRTYRIVFQCRVENDQFTEHQKPVSVGLALRVFNEKAIRPYGLLLKADSIEQIS